MAAKGTTAKLLQRKTAILILAIAYCIPYNYGTRKSSSLGDKMKIYTIVGGVNGVGKSSFTGVLKECSTDLGVIIDVDKITAELGGNALAGGKGTALL